MRRLLAGAVLCAYLALFGMAAVGSVAAQATAAPDCSTVGYTTDASGAFEVENASQLQCIGNASTNTSPSEDFVLVAAIDAATTSGWNDGHGFDPVGTEARPFNGTFDGGNHSITGLESTRPASAGIGLFGVTGTDAVIERVAITDATVRGNTSVGGLVGRNDGTVQSSTVAGNITGKMDVGGLAGTNRPTGLVTDSSAAVQVSGFDPEGCTEAPRGSFHYRFHNTTASVTVTYGGGETFDTGRVSFAGGVEQSGQTWAAVAERTAHESRITAGDSVTLNMTSNDAAFRMVWESASETEVVIARTDTHQLLDNGVYCEDTNVGGLVGTNNGTVENASASGDVNATERVGGLVGLNDGLVKSGSADGTVAGGTRVGGLVGKNVEGTVTQSWATASVERTTTTGLPVYPQRRYFTYEYRAGPETVTVRLEDNDTFDPRRVSFAGDVEQHGQTWREVTGNESTVVPGETVTLNSTAGANYELMLAFTFESGNISTIISEDAGAESADAPHFNVFHLTAPLKRFYGGLVGVNNGTVVASNATGRVRVGPTESSVPVTGVGGLIGKNGPLGTVNDSTARGAVISESWVGGLVGYNDGGTVTSSSATGDVSGDGSVGGLVGNNSGTVTTSSAMGDVTNVSEWGTELGGLVGESSGKVASSFATGNVTNDADLTTSSVGGLVGSVEESGTVESSYATGDVSGNNAVSGLDGDEVGGLVGYNEGTVRSTYATGNVTGISQVGGVVGHTDEGGAVTSSYWDANTTGQHNSAGNATGLTTSQMTGDATRTAMDGFDFGTTWTVVDSVHGDNWTVSYPYLLNNTQQPPPGQTTRPLELTLSALDIAGRGTDATVAQRDNESVTVNVTNTGDGEVTVPVSLAVAAGAVDQRTRTVDVTLAAGETERVVFEHVTGAMPVGGFAPTGGYEVVVTAGESAVNGTLSVSVDIGGDGTPARDLDSDGLVEDVRGDGSTDIFDVQTLFGNLDSPVLQNNSALFDFQGDGSADVNVVDVQALFGLAG